MVGHANDQNAHPAFGAVNDPRRDVDHGAFTHRMFLAIQDNGAFSIKHVIQFCGSPMEMFTRPIDVHGMRPGRNVLIFAADKAVAPAAGTAFAGNFAFVADED